MTNDRNQVNTSGEEGSSMGRPPGFKRFITLRVVVGITLSVIVLWGFWTLMDFFGRPDKLPVAESHKTEPIHDIEEPASGVDGHEEPEVPAHRIQVPHETAAHSPAVDSHRPPLEVPGITTPQESRAKGVTFVEATIAVLDYELNKRFWGWRRNDIIRITDNVENMQLGVLEVVRRATVNLAERISRHGMSDALDNNLENAMNWLMIKPDRYWLPSAEAKYNDSLKELHAYAERLESGQARFYIRTDNLIPLIVSFADLAGSCDENLVKTKEKDGSPVSWFKVDDYFYYAKGTAGAMAEILHAVREDFSNVLEERHGVDLLHHAIHACHVAAELDPWLVTDASLDGILANHRANIAAHMSHVQYFLNALAKALST